MLTCPPRGRVGSWFMGRREERLVVCEAGSIRHMMVPLFSSQSDWPEVVCFLTCMTLKLLVNQTVS